MYKEINSYDKKCSTALNKDRRFFVKKERHTM